MSKLNFEYDEEKDIMTIEGMRYAGDLFRAFSEGGMNIGEEFRIVERHDGVVTLVERLMMSQSRPGSTPPPLNESEYVRDHIKGISPITYNHDPQEAKPLKNITVEIEIDKMPNSTCDHCFRPFVEDKFHPGTCGNCGAPCRSPCGERGLKPNKPHTPKPEISYDDIELLKNSEKELKGCGLI